MEEHSPGCEFLEIERFQVCWIQAATSYCESDRRPIYNDLTFRTVPNCFMAGRSNGPRRNPIRSCRRRMVTGDEEGPWAYLQLDILTVIMMKLGLIDFLAFSGVCKPWRSIALSIRNTFLAQKEPLLLTLSKNVCTLRDTSDERRRYRTVLGDPAPCCCVGVSCGYLIIRPRRAAELSIVNPITRHELYFPTLPKGTPYFYGRFRAILVYASWLSRFVVIVLCREDNCVLFSGSGDSEWVMLPDPGQEWDIVDLAFFKRKVYMLNNDGRLGELRLNPIPSLQFLDVKKKTTLHKHTQELVVSSDEQRFMVDTPSPRITIMRELDFEKMKWVKRKDLGDDKLFLNRVKCSAIVNSTNWLARERAQGNSIYTLPPPVEGGDWYFPHECCNNNLLTDS